MLARVLAAGLCPCVYLYMRVCLSVCHKPVLDRKTAVLIEQIIDCGLPSTYHTLRFKGIKLSPT